MSMQYRTADSRLHREHERIDGAKAAIGLSLPDGYQGPLIETTAAQDRRAAVNLACGVRGAGGSREALLEVLDALGLTPERCRAVQQA